MHLVYKRRATEALLELTSRQYFETSATSRLEPSSTERIGRDMDECLVDANLRGDLCAFSERLPGYLPTAARTIRATRIAAHCPHG